MELDGRSHEDPATKTSHVPPDSSARPSTPTSPRSVQSTSYASPVSSQGCQALTTRTPSCLWLPITSPTIPDINLAARSCRRLFSVFLLSLAVHIPRCGDGCSSVASIIISGLGARRRILSLRATTTSTLLLFITHILYIPVSPTIFSLFPLTIRPGAKRGK